MLLTGYRDDRYGSATAAQRAAFERLLELPDPDLLQLLLGAKVTDDATVAELVQQIRSATDR